MSPSRDVQSEVTLTTMNPPPGWYPTGPDTVRWWDGHQWGQTRSTRKPFNPWTPIGWVALIALVLFVGVPIVLGLVWLVLAISLA